MLSRDEVIQMERHEATMERRSNEGEWSKPLVEKLKAFIIREKNLVKKMAPVGQREVPFAVLKDLNALVQDWEIRH